MSEKRKGWGGDDDAGILSGNRWTEDLDSHSWLEEETDTEDYGEVYVVSKPYVSPDVCLTRRSRRRAHTDSSPEEGRRPGERRRCRKQTSDGLAGRSDSQT